MPSGIPYQEANEVLDLEAGTRYLAIATADPGQDKTALATEMPDADGYARQVCTMPVASGTSGVVSSTDAQAFTNTDTVNAWPNGTFFVLCDSATHGGSWIRKFELAAPFVVNPDSTNTVPAGAVQHEVPLENA
ncbi:MAG: hypothetical protein AAF581_11220 [Planctomycetota bacterium]